MKNLVILMMLFLPQFNEIEWGTDFKTAANKAEINQKTVLITFSGSDWCKPCILLHQKLYDTPEFGAYASENLELVKADFPSRKKNKLSPEQTAKNEALAEKFNPEGVFPLAVFVSPSGEILGTFGYDKVKTPKDYINAFKQYLK
jgi:thioredoxin-related protein